MTVKRVAGAVAVVAVVVVPLSGPPQGRDSADAPPVRRATVTVHGSAGTFGATVDATPSGQGFARVAVPGWGFPAGRQVGAAAVAADGTVLMATVHHHWDVASPPAAELVVGAYDPAANAHANVPIRPAPGRAGGAPAPSIVELEPVASGRAVAFTALPSRGGWPAFGVLTRADGGWRVAGGPGWVNQWSGDELAGDLGQLAAFPRSRDLIAVQHGAERPSAGGRGLVALRVTGPDAAGRVSVTVRGRYRYPAVRVPGGRGPLDVGIREVQTDPTGRLGDERFSVNLAVAGGPFVLQELSYDAATGRIRPVSAPIIPGDKVQYGTDLIGYGSHLYDHAGNLWVSRLNVLHGGKLAVYAKAGGERRLGRACRHDPGRPLGAYRTRGERRTVWGRGCRPDYDILQAQHLLGIQGIRQDPATRDIVALGLTGHLLPIRATGAGRNMSFRVGNLVDLGRKLLPTADGNINDHRIGGIDGAHRAWVTALQGSPENPGARVDQWLYSVDLRDLFAPSPVTLPEVPGRRAIVQAERSLITSTHQRPGGTATMDVDSDAYVHGCVDWPANVTCGYDGVPGNGYVLGDDTGFGHLRGEIRYGVDVPSAGRYRLGYRVATFPVLKRARITLTAGGRRYTTPVDTAGSWRTSWADDLVTLPAGVQTITLSIPAGGGGWHLNSIIFERA